MPVTLIEGMAGGVPIACAERGPMPEILQDAGEYFDPEDPASIAGAIERIMLHPAESQARAQRAAALARQYSWARCAEETWAFLSEVASGAPRGGEIRGGAGT
jgi:glycosyltransferase involved in cell wall biosynthesis